MKRGLDDLIAVKIKEAKEKDLIFQKENAGNDFLHKKRKSERNVNIDDKKKNKVVKLKAYKPQTISEPSKFSQTVKILASEFSIISKINNTNNIQKQNSNSSMMSLFMNSQKGKEKDKEEISKLNMAILELTKKYQTETDNYKSVIIDINNNEDNEQKPKNIYTLRTVKRTLNTINEDKEKNIQGEFNLKTKEKYR